jgi:hypothetical protein
VRSGAWRLKTIVSLQEEKQEVLPQIRTMREWVMEVEHIFAGSWASQAVEISNAAVRGRLDAWLARLAAFVEADARTEDEQLRLGQLRKRDDAFEARLSPMLRCGGVSSHQQ